MKLHRRLLFLFIMALYAANVAGQSFTVEVPKVVSSGETFRLVYTSDGEVKEFTPPDLSSFEVLAGPTSSTMNSTQIINGKRTQSFQMSYTYILQSKTVGKYSIGKASATIDGKRYDAPGVTIEVVKGEEGKSSSKGESGTSISKDDLFLRIAISKSKVVKGEQLVATIKLYTKVPIAGFEDVRFPSFNGFWSQELETPQNVEFVRENVGGKVYDAALIRRYLLIPQQSGSLTIDPAEMVCQVQIKSPGQSRSFFDDFFDSYQTVRKRLSTGSTKIKVDELPAGAPASFKGAVGSFSLGAELSRDTLNANEAASLFVTIRGRGNINLVEAPQLSLPAQFEGYDVKVTDNSQSLTGDGVKRFEFPFIPRGEGTYALPVVEFSFFDISKGKYVTLKSGPFELRVGKGDMSGASTAGSIPLVNKKDVKSLGSDVRYIITGEPSLQRGHSFFITSLFYYIILVVILLSLYALFYVVKREVAKRSDVAGVKNRRANKVAKGRLKGALALLKEHNNSKFYEEIHRAVIGYCSDKFLISMAEMSRDRISEILVSKGIQEHLVKSLIGVIDDCEYARFAPDKGDSGMQEIYKKALDVISGFES